MPPAEVEANIVAKFGPPPVPHAHAILGAQFAGAAVILLAVQPPFVCGDGRVRASLVLLGALLTTGCLAATYHWRISTADIFRGALMLWHQGVAH